MQSSVSVQRTGDLFWAVPETWQHLHRVMYDATSAMCCARAAKSAPCMMRVWANLSSGSSCVVCCYAYHCCGGSSGGVWRLKLTQPVQATLALYGGYLLPYYLHEETGWSLSIDDLRSQTQKVYTNGLFLRRTEATYLSQGHT